jgi:hypothetical protein
MVCIALQVGDWDDGVKRAIAAKIIDLAKAGERNPDNSVVRRQSKFGRNADSTYRSGRSPDWLKMKNPACEAVRREAEEDWGR